MTIWTTPQLHQLLMPNVQFVKLFSSQSELKDRFLVTAAPGDVAILFLDGDYLDFLDAAKVEALGPIIFVSPDPIIIKNDLSGANAIILDVKSMGLPQSRNVVSLLLDLTVKRSETLKIEPTPGNKPAAKPKEERIEDAPTIKGMLTYVIANTLPAIVSFDIIQDGTSVTARGICNIKQLENNALILYRFRREQMLKGMNKGVAIKLGFTFKQKAIECMLTIQKTNDDEVSTNVPKTLFLTRDMRIQPNPGKPLGLYILFPGTITATIRCTVVDISTHGIGFTCAKDFPIAQACMCTLVLPESGTILLTQGTIRFKKEIKNGFHYGAEIRPHAWDEEEIAKYVMNRESEIINSLRG
jgi:hypothetical protein